MMITRGDPTFRKSLKNLYQLFVFVPHKEVLAQRTFISEHAYAVKEEQPEPLRNVQIAHMTTAIYAHDFQPCISVHKHISCGQISYG